MRRELIKTWRAARRIKRVRRKVRGEVGRPRLAVMRSLRNIGAQIIDDDRGRTLCAVSTESKELQVGYGGNVAAAKLVGKALAEKAKQLGIEQVSFDRRGHKYHGRVKALADAAREAGLKL